MQPVTFEFEQNIFKASYGPISVTRCDECNLKNATVKEFVDSASPTAVLGLAPIYSVPKHKLLYLAFASSTKVLIVRLSDDGPSKRKKAGNIRALLELASRTKAAFRMDKLASSLYLDYGQYISSAVDILSVSKSSRRSLAALMDSLGGENLLERDNVEKLFEFEERVGTPFETTATQAWLACWASEMEGMSIRFLKAPRMNTSPDSLSNDHLDAVATLMRHSERLEDLKPTYVKNEVASEFVRDKNGNIIVTSTRYPNRLRSSPNDVQFEFRNGEGESETRTGRPRVDGTSATLRLDGPAPVGDMIYSVTTIGKERPLRAEQQKAIIILKVLQGEFKLSRIFSSIWSPQSSCSNSDASDSSDGYVSERATCYDSDDWEDLAKSLIKLNIGTTLNDSQRAAVMAILSKRPEDEILLIHGPPGTGKTTVIASSVASIIEGSGPDATVWLIAQSNVAVKNMAEKLATNFTDFKIVVSKDFHFGWHEHLYHRIDDNVIRSDELTDDVVTMARLLLDSRVILCTLSMLSNPRLATVANLVPIQTVLVDEASQIAVGDLLPMVHRYQRTLKKLVFIGDDKQLAPHGQSDIRELQSIFEMPHLRDRAVFLDTQYRIPTCIGQFISQNVYDGRLKSCHELTSMSCCRLVDVADALEQKQGHSWKSTAEAKVVMEIAKQLSNANKSYRIITPYDAQRSLLEQSIKAARLPWEDKCFNVDSFQGNEDDYIIISLVRSDKVGFLRELRRVNVMLTRCKKGMAICTSRKFLRDIAPGSLVGKLSEEFGDTMWVDSKDILKGDEQLFDYQD